MWLYMSHPTTFTWADETDIAWYGTKFNPAPTWDNSYQFHVWNRREWSAPSGRKWNVY